MLSAHRSDRNDTYETRKTYQAGLRAEHNDDGRPGWIRISFATNPEGVRQQVYEVRIRPDYFETVAREMLRADPEKAIRAFGAAMHDFEKPKPI